MTITSVPNFGGWLLAEAKNVLLSPWPVPFWSLPIICCVMGAITQQMIGKDQNGTGHGDSSTFFASASSQPPKLGTEVIVIRTAQGMGGLNQKRFEVTVAFGGLGG